MRVLGEVTAWMGIAAVVVVGACSDDTRVADDGAPPRPCSNWSDWTCEAFSGGCHAFCTADSDADVLCDPSGVCIYKTGAQSSAFCQGGDPLSGASGCGFCESAVDVDCYSNLSSSGGTGGMTNGGNGGTGGGTGGSGGTGACVEDNEPCEFNIECCSGPCQANLLCGPGDCLGEPCVFDRECCTGFCHGDGFCGNCTEDNMPCSFNDDCCSRFCDVDALCAP